MNRIAGFLPMLALVVATGSAVAATEVDRPMDRSFATLDHDRDGVVSREEAAVMPGLVESFDQLDANADAVLEPNEIGVGGPVSGPAGR